MNLSIFKLSNMSYRYRIPLSLVATVLFTSSVIGGVVVWHTYNNVRAELVENGAQHGYSLAAALQPALLHDDVWLAYTLLRGSHEIGGNRRVSYVMLDSNNRIFASSTPDLFPIATPLHTVAPDLDSAVMKLSDSNMSGFSVEMDVLPEQLLLVNRISANGDAIGKLLTIYPRRILWPRFSSIIEQGTLSVLLILVVIIPVGWFSGRHLVQPLLNLAACMVRVNNEDPEKIECAVATGDDEIGRLNRHFQELLSGLKEKAELERQMVSSERLAAVGRLAAGVAHEVNNPLGGMLVAIDTLRQRGISEPYTEKTLSLLERGLLQIQDTVSALLLESRMESHPLTAQDIDDTYTLIVAQSGKRGVTVEWNNRTTESLSLPSTLVRQIIINLLLNAVQSTPKGGVISASFGLESNRLQIIINNSGSQISGEALKHLFEPYFSTHEEGSGLGLWVTYQIVQQLAGWISVDSTPVATSFTVTLPLRSMEQ